MDFAENGRGAFVFGVVTGDMRFEYAHQMI